MIKQYLILIPINYGIGLLFAGLYWLCLNELHLNWTHTFFVVNTFGYFVAVGEMWYGFHKARQEIKSPDNTDQQPI